MRFDHFGRGASSGEASIGTIGRWAEDAIAVVDSLTQGRQILVGSEMCIRDRYNALFPLMLEWKPHRKTIPGASPTSRW